MKTARLVVLGISLAAGGGAMYLMNGTKAPPAAVVEALPVPQPKFDTADVLVSAHELPLGSLIGDGDLTWTAWPSASARNGIITRGSAPNSLQDLKGSIVRSAFVEGEPIRPEKLVKGISSGFLSAILPTGMRAVSISIDSQGTNTAGGFILPNDRVDVVRTGRDEDGKGGAEAFVTDTILSDVRVLAIGQNVQEKNGERTVTGANATLEVDPRQAEALILAQRIGSLSLVLRSLLDAGRAPAQDNQSDERALTVIRYGVSANVAKR